MKDKEIINELEDIEEIKGRDLLYGDVNLDDLFEEQPQENSNADELNKILDEIEIYNLTPQKEIENLFNIFSEDNNFEEQPKKNSNADELDKILNEIETYNLTPQKEIENLFNENYKYSKPRDEYLQVQKDLDPKIQTNIEKETEHRVTISRMNRQVEILKGILIIDKQFDNNKKNRGNERE